MSHENSQRAARYRERANALRSIAEQTESISARLALKDAAADYDLMAQRLETINLRGNLSQRAALRAQ